MKNLNLHKQIWTYLFFIYSILNVVHIPECHVNAIQDDIIVTPGAFSVKFSLIKNAYIIEASIYL